MTRFALLPLLLALASLAPLYAQDAPPPGATSAPAAPRPWRSLDAAQQDVLAPLRGHWDSMPPRKQAHMLKRAEHWVTLPPEQRERLHEAYEHFQQMPPDQRERLLRQWRAQTIEQRLQGLDHPPGATPSPSH